MKRTSPAGLKPLAILCFKYSHEMNSNKTREAVSMKSLKETVLHVSAVAGVHSMCLFFLNPCTPVTWPQCVVIAIKTSTAVLNMVSLQEWALPTGGGGCCQVVFPSFEELGEVTSLGMRFSEPLGQCGHACPGILRTVVQRRWPGRFAFWVAMPTQHNGPIAVEG